MTRDLESLFAHQRSQFPGLSGDLVHLNNAAGSEMPETAIAAMAAFMRTGFVNEGKIFGRLARCAELSHDAHQATADLLGAEAAEIAIMPSTTAAVFSVSRALARTWAAGDRVLISEACHEANIAPWLALRQTGVTVDFIPMRADTHIDYEWLEANIDARTRLVSFGASSNGTGTMHDIARVVRVAKSAGALVSLDAAHFAPHRPIDVRALDVDLLFFSIYKCCGPHIGAVYVRRALADELSPFAAGPGGPGAWKLESGSRPFESYAGWLATIDYLEALGKRAAATPPSSRPAALTAAMTAIGEWETVLAAHLDAAFADVPGLVEIRQPRGDARPRLGVLCFNLARRDTADIARGLEKAGIEAVMGSNGAVRTMSKLAADFGGIGIRLSLAHYNNRADIDRAAAAVRAIART